MAGPDGNLWFADDYGGKIGRITPTGTITEYSIPTAGSSPVGIAAGPGGSLWFTESSSSATKIGRAALAPPPTVTRSAPTGGTVAGGTTLMITGANFLNKVGRITPSGMITEFSVPTANSQPVGVAAGPDGNLWFTEDAAGKIGQMTPAGVVIAEYPVPTPSGQPHDIAVGPDGNLWFTEFLGDRIGRITPAGIVTEYSIPTPSSGPTGIAAGPDGNVWFAEEGSARIGRITPAGVIAEYPISTASSGSFGITAGPDGNLWFTELDGNRIGRVTPAGVITEFSAGLTGGSGPAFITTGPGGDLWFTERDGDRIGRAKIAPRLLAAAPRSGPTTGGTTVTLTGTGFLAGATVTFDGVAGTNVTVVSATQITVTTPAHPTAATVDVVVTNPGGGTDTLTHGYTYGTPNPVPPPRPPGSSGGGPPNPLPAPRPGGTIGGSAPNPVPAPRP